LPVLSLRELNRSTLARQMLLARDKVAPVRAIEALVGMQAQFPRPPFLGLWARSEGFRREGLTKLFLQRKVVRATFLRGTLHMATARDFVALRPAMQRVLDAGMSTILKALGARVDPLRLAAKAREVLADGPLTFEEIRERLKRTEPGTNERALGFAVRMLLPLVQVPVGEGAAWAFPANARFALADQWLGKAIATDRPALPDAFVLRYFAAYGPATVADLQAWSGLPKLRETVEALRKRLVTFQDERGRELFDLPEAPRPDGDVPAPVRLVPDYDNLITTRSDERFVAKAHRPRVFLPGLRVAATVLVDGFVAGAWRTDRRKDVATLTVDPFAPLSARTRREVTAEAEALLRFAEPEARSYEIRMGK
jgi:Winged helix DNA-binding domain